MRLSVMKGSMILLPAVLVFALTACDGGGNGGGDEDGDGTTVVTVTASPNIVEDDGRFFSIGEVGFGADGYVALTNFTEVAASLDGLYVCQPPDCVELPSEEIRAGRTAIVAMGDGSELEGVVLADGGLTLKPTDGEVGLYASEKVNSAQDIRAYVEWGSTPHDGTPTAIEAGLWLEGSFVESASDAERIYRAEDTSWTFE